MFYLYLINNNRPIILITAEGDEIEFESTSECVKFTGAPYHDITRVLKGERKNCLGYTFKYKAA